MKERPIIFKDEMVRAILDGRKTQTRRAVKPQPAGARAIALPDGWGFDLVTDREGQPQRYHETIRSPYGQPGDRLWLREAHAFVPEPAYRRSTGIYQQINPDDDYEACVYRENFDRARSFPWRPSIHMPRWASRITLEIANVRVERLQDISEADALAEGGPEDSPCGDAVGWFADLWDKINGDDAWDANPWVWVIEFRRIRP